MTTQSRAGRASGSTPPASRAAGTVSAATPSSRSRSGPSSVLYVDAVSQRFKGVPVLDEVGFNIGDGERVGLIGPNGAGKSTLLRIMAGLLPPDAGVAGRRGGSLGFLEQDAELSSRLPLVEEMWKAFPEARAVEEQLHEVAAAFESARRRRRRAGQPAGAAVRRVRPPGRLSHRQAHRAGAARARLPTRGQRQALRGVLGWLADARRAGAGARPSSRSPAARRAHQPPRRRRADVADRPSPGLQGHGDDRLARDRLPGCDGAADHRPARRRGALVPRQPQRLPPPAGRAAGAAARDRRPPAARDRPADAVHRSLPQHGHQGQAGAEPDQGARQDRAGDRAQRRAGRALPHPAGGTGRSAPS